MLANKINAVQPTKRMNIRSTKTLNALVCN